MEINKATTWGKKEKRATVNNRYFVAFTVSRAIDVIATRWKLCRKKCQQSSHMSHTLTKDYTTFPPFRPPFKPSLSHLQQVQRRNNDIPQNVYEPQIKHAQNVKKEKRGSKKMITA